MQKKFDLSVKQLYLLIFITAASLIGLGLYGIDQYKKLNDNTRTLYADRMVCIRQLSDIRSQYETAILSIPQNVKNGTLSFSEAKKRVLDAEQIIDTNWRSYKHTYLTPEEKLLVKQTETIKNQVDEAAKNLVAILSKEDTPSLNQLMQKETFSGPTPFILKLNQLIDLQMRVAKDVIDNNKALYKGTSTNFILFIGLSLVIAISLSALIIKNIGRLIKDILQSHDRIEAGENKYRSILENASDAIYLVDKRERFIEANDTMCKMLGYSKDELLQLRIEDIFDNEQQKTDPVNLSLIPYHSTFKQKRFIRKDGAAVEVEIHGRRIDDSKWMGVARDITERKAIETELREAEMKFRTLAEKSMLGVYISQNRRFLYVNQRFAEIFGYTCQELMDLSAGVIDTIYAEESRAMIREKIRARDAGETEGAHYEAIGLRKDGSKTYVELYGNRVTINGHPAAIGTALDITERKLADEELKLSKKNLERYNRELNLLNTINDVILRNEDELELYTEVCNCIVRSGGYKLAWVCCKPNENDADQILKPLAAAGAMDYLSDVKIDLSDPEQAGGPTGTVMRTGKTFVNNDANHIDFFAPWAERAKEHGIQSSLALYLDLGNGKAGALMIYSGQTNAFDPHELYILERLAANVSVAVQTIRIGINLSESEARFRGAFENASIGVGLVSLQGQWLKVNRALCEMLGYTDDELLKLDFQQVTHRDDLASDLEYLEKAVSGQQNLRHVEKRYLHKDGRIIWVSLNVSLIRDQNNQPLYYISQIENITEKVESQLKFQNLVENFIVGVYIHQNGKIVYVNPRLLEESGYFEEEVMGRPIEHFIYKEDLDLVKKITEQREKEHIDTVRYEARFVRKDGRPVWFEIFGSRTVYQGAPALMGTLVNISERKAFYDELKKSEANLRSIFDSTDVSYLMLDTNYNIVSLNQQMRDIYRETNGITLTEGDNLIELMRPERQQMMRELYDNVQLTKKPSGYESSYTVGVTRHFAASVFPIIVGDEAIGICISTIDITEVKNALKKLEQANEDLQNKAKELAISNAELEQFAYVASHDLQEPLRMVTSFLTQLEKKYAGVLDDKAKQYIYFATDGAKRMRQLILDLLEYSRVGRSENDLEDVNFNALTEEVLALFRRHIEETNATVRFKDLPTLNTYKTPMRQVFQNLVGNALKYHKRDISPVVEITCIETGPAFEFIVSDNGIGIDPEYFDQIFIIFKRLHNREEYAGTGMGLAITKKIIEHAGGKIWVTSKEGHGAAFHFTIPKHP